jgi:hypothetical protein
MSISPYQAVDIFQRVMPERRIVAEHRASSIRIGDTVLSVRLLSGSLFVGQSWWLDQPVSHGGLS